jgi:hypothetical protein
MALERISEGKYKLQDGGKSMKIVISYTIALVLIFASITRAAEINLKVETDRSDYHAGDTVSWTIYAYASQGDNRGVASLSVNLDDDRGEMLEAPLHNSSEFTDTAYGVEELFLMLGTGTPATETPRLRDMFVMQMPGNRRLDIGNDGDPNHILAKGSYVATALGTHVLTVTFNGANYWPNETDGAVDFEIKNPNSCSFNVFRKADINKSGIVEVGDLVILCQQWLQAPGDPSADIAPDPVDNFVDLRDFAALAEEWLK